MLKVEAPIDPAVARAVGLGSSAADAPAWQGANDGARPEICSRRIRRFQRALIVDDDEGLRRALARLVRTWGCEVIEAMSVSEGRRMLAQAPDLLIVDVRLPDGSGREVAVAAGKLSPRPLMVAMSGLASASEAFALAQQGARIYLTKPFAQQELVEAIEVFLASETSDNSEHGSAGLSLNESLSRFEQRYHVTEREMALVRLVMAGVPRSRCPALLNVSENTCKTMTRRLLQRCGARNVADIPRMVLLRESEE
jgi:DNA-binding NarL/FixJ family response regulator